jgi:hypothetical protein
MTIAEEYWVDFEILAALESLEPPLVPQKTYRILEAWEDCPDRHYTMGEALEELAPYTAAVGVELKEDHGLLNYVGTAFYLQEVSA